MTRCGAMVKPDHSLILEALELESRVQSLLVGRVRDFQIFVVDNGIVLRGTTRSYYAKQLAQHAVQQAIPVPIRANEIEVT